MRAKRAIVNIERRSARSTLIQLATCSAVIQNLAVRNHGFPSKLHHEVPAWVEPGSLFHIRIGLDRDHVQRPLTDTSLATSLLESARRYEKSQRWHIILFLLMPDHLHALLSFAQDEAMSKVIGQWKHYQSHQYGIIWQENYFDHRLRDDERGEQLSAKVNYIRNNPVVAGLCPCPENWPWVIG